MRFLSSRRSWFGCILGLLLAVLPVAPSAVAQQALPPIDLLVYLDNSKTIFTGGADAPNRRLVSLLEAVFTYRIDEGRRSFVTAGDRVSFYTFGKRVTPIKEGVDGADLEALKSALKLLESSPTGDNVTDFTPLLQDIARRDAVRIRDDNRLKIVLIASDFIHDPLNASISEKKDGRGICEQIRRFETGGRSILDGEVAALGRAIAIPAEATDRLPVFTGLLVVRPTEADFAGLNSGYRTCALDTARLRPLPQLLESQLSAQSIEYAEASRDVGRFANTFVTAVLRSTLPALQVVRGECRPRGESGLECGLTLRNGGRVANDLRELVFYGDGFGAPLARVPVAPPVSILPGREVERTVVIDDAAGRTLSAARSLKVSAASGSRAPAPRSDIAYMAVTPLIIEAATAARSRNDEPYTVTLKLGNRQPRPKTPVGISFRDAVSGRQFPDLVANNAEPVPGNGGSTRLTVPLPRDAEAALRADGVQISVQSTEADGTTLRRSDYRAIDRETERPLAIESVSIAMLTDNPLSAAVTLTLVNGNPRVNTVSAVQFKHRDGRAISAAPSADSMAVPPNGRAPLTVRLSEMEAAAALENDLAIAVEDTLTGSPSDPREIPRLRPKRTFLAPASCAWGLPTPGTGNATTLRCVVENTGTFSTRIARLTLQPVQSAAAVRQDLLPLPVNPPTAVSPGSRVTVAVDLRLNRGVAEPDARGVPVDLNRNGWLSGEGMQVTVADEDGNESIPLQTAGLPKGALSFGEPAPRFEPDTAGQLSVTLQIRNDTPLPRTVRAIKISRSGEPASNGEALPLNADRLVLQPYSSVPLKLSFSDNVRKRYDPHLTHRLTIDEAGKTEGPAEQADIQALQTIPLALAGMRWLKLPIPALQIAIRNPAPYHQTLEGVLLAANRQERAERYPLPDTPEIGPEAQWAMQIPFPEERARRLQGGDEFLICILTHGVRPERPDADQCPDGNWAPVRFGKEREPLVAVPDEQLLSAGAGSVPSSVNLRVSNPGPVPNRPTGINFYTSDGKLLFEKKLTSTRPILAGASDLVRVPLESHELREAIRAITPKLMLHDLSLTSQNPSGGGELRVAMLDVRFLNQKILPAEVVVQKVPGAAPYTAVRVRFTVEPTPGVPLPTLPVEVVLRPSDGSRPGSIPVELHKDNRIDREFTAAWKYPYSFEGHENASLDILQPRVSSLAETHQLQATAEYDLKRVMLIAAVALFLGFVVAVFIFKRYVVDMSSLTHSLDKFDRIERDVTRYLKYFGITSVGGAAFLLNAWFGTMWKELAFVPWIVSAVFAGALGLFLVLAAKWWWFGQLASQGSRPVELPILLSRWHFWGRLVVVLSFLGMLGLYLAYPDLHTPLDPSKEQYHWEDGAPPPAPSSGPRSRTALSDTFTTSREASR